MDEILYALVDKSGNIVTTSPNYGKLLADANRRGKGERISQVSVTQLEDLDTPKPSRPLATIEDIRESVDEDASIFTEPSQSGLLQMESNPLKTIDTVRIFTSTNAAHKEKKLSKRDYQLKKLFLQYINKYSKNIENFKRYPRQIKQEPAWFYHALDLFKENEISSANKKRIIGFVKDLQDYKSQNAPDTMLSEEESLRQHGLTSRYSEETPLEGEFSGESYVDDIDTEGLMKSTTAQMRSQADLARSQRSSQEPQYQSDDLLYGAPPSIPSYTEDTMGVGKLQSTGDQDFIAGYISPIKSSISSTPDTNFGRPSAKVASVGGSFGDTLSSAIFGKRPAPQPVSQEPQSIPVVSRNKAKSSQHLNRKTPAIKSVGLTKYRNIDLPTINTSGKRGNIDLPNINTLGKRGKKSNRGMFSLGGGGFDIQLNKQAGSNNSVRNDINGVVKNINLLKTQVRGEMKNNNSITINSKSNSKRKPKSDIDVLKKLKVQTKSTVSRKALECKMIPKLKDQCHKVFTNNQITNEVGKFKNEFKEVSKMVPTVKGENAYISEVGILGNSIDSGVRHSNVENSRDMYRKSGTTKLMNIGTFNFDFSSGIYKKKKNYYEEGDV